jgi:hypothetical protein
MKKAIYIFTLLVSFVTSNGQVTLNNRTGIHLDALEISCRYIGFLAKDSSITINECNDATLIQCLYSRERIAKKPGFWCGTLPHHCTEPITLPNIKAEYDIVYFEHLQEFGLIYQEELKTDVKKSYAFTGEYLPMNDEGDKLAAICKEGLLSINDDCTFNYILTTDKVWCPDQKDSTYDGSWTAKNDTLYLQAKGNKQLVEPKFNFTETDLNNEITISLYNETGELIEIEDAQSISSTKNDMNRNSFKIPFNKNYIKLNDKRILGLTVYPVGYPEVQIVLKKIKAGAKINVTLFNNYYDTFFSNRKFVYSYNVLTEVTSAGKVPANYIKNK